MRTRYRIAAPFTKIDEATRTIEGAVTIETVDADGEIVDYATAKTVIAGTWPGNLREMHQLIAAGTGAVVECDDATKTVRVRGHVSKGAPSTWEKCLDGTLKAFSIGGEAARRVAEKAADGVTDVKRLFLKNVHEISLVDNPACPGCGFEVIRVAKGVAALAGDDQAVLVKRKISQEERDKIPATDCAGPNKSFPIAIAEDVSDAASSLGRAGGGAPARARIKSRIISIAYRKGGAFVDALPDAWKKKADQKQAVAKGWPKVQKADGDELTPMDLECEPMDVDRAARLVADLNWLICSEVLSAQRLAAMGSADAATELAQVAMLKAAVEELMAFLDSEFHEQFGEEPDMEDDGAEGPDEDDEDGGVTVTLARRVAMLKAVGSLLSVGKIGAEFSAKNKQKIQAIHDHTTDMGATCKAPEEVDADAKKKAAGAADADGEVCATCKGEATTPACADCAGTGKAKKPPKPPACKNCDGSGDCPECEGTGKVAAEKPDDKDDDDEKARKAAKKIDCPECDGSGNCTECNGTGAKGLKRKAAAAGATEVVVKMADMPAVRKLIDDTKKLIDATKAENASLKETTTAQAATISKLETRLQVVEKMPAAGGPAVRVADKAIAGTAGGGGGDAALTPDQLSDVIKQMPESPAKDVLLVELHKMRTAAGLGVKVLGQ